MCPSISDGVYPECKCRHGKSYDNETNSCPDPQCPLNTTVDSVYPKCKCLGKNREYNAHLNECYLVCPEDSIGFFPECQCNDRLSGFNKGNQFLGFFFASYCCIVWSQQHNKAAKSGIKRNQEECVRMFSLFPDLFECMRCPAGSTCNSIYPNCKTETIANATYDLLYNEFRVCHSGSHGKYPDCTCENGNGWNRFNRAIHILIATPNKNYNWIQLN